MAGPWLRRALGWTTSNRPIAVAFGVTAAGTGIWFTQNSQWWQQHRPFHQSSISSRSVQANLSLDNNTQPSSSSSSSSSQHTPSLVFASGASMIPHPAKKEKGGEDAYFITDNGICIGVADGVGGWAEIGVDPGLYSRELMNHAKSIASSLPSTPDVPQKALELAHERTTARGSCTACILYILDDTLYASNLGDSGFLVVRNGELAFMSPQQQHEFNFPYQIGSIDSMADSPTAAQRFSLKVHEGDIVVAATDGLFDNVYPDEAAALVSLSKDMGEEPSRAAMTLAQFARTRAADSTHLSPFAYGAQQLGFRYFGGKMDDITVVVGFVTGRSGGSDSDSDSDDEGDGDSRKKSRRGKNTTPQSKL